MPDPFISPQDLVDYLGRGTATDPGMVIATDAACDMCRTVAEQPFNADTSTVTLDGTGTDAILLPKLPVTAAGTVLVNGGTVTDYVLNDNGMLIRKYLPDQPVSPYYNGVYWPRVWPQGRQNIRVTYDHGYQTVDLPRDVRMVALSIASRLVIQGPTLQEAVGNVSARYAYASTDLSNGELRILSKYRQTR